MCGICGYVGLAPDGVRLGRMVALMAHRGPDDEGTYTDGQVALGHKRLSIIDLATGHQPMVSADGRYVIVFNGEIYNYRELRGILEARGRVFRTHSDTEVLLYWMIDFGVKRLPDLNGMFAFALWDRDNGSLLLVRDRLGIKPLYVHRRGRALVFASEIKALLPAMEQKEANPAAIHEFLTFQNILGKHTFFKDVDKLPAGGWVRWGAEGISEGRFWDVAFTRSFDGTFADAAEEYAATLAQAVARHMIADVPVGAYLSGGIDSPSAATLAAGMCDGPLHTFTGAFTDAPYYDERVGSRAVAENIRAVRHEIEITPEDYLRDYAKVIYHLDEPTLGTGALPCYEVARLVSDSVKVVLTGHGGDEMFAGYQVNQVALIRETMRRSPARLLSVLLGVKKDEWTRVLYYLLYPLVYPEVKHGIFIMVPRRQRAQLLSEGFLRQNGGSEPLDALAPFLDNDDSPGERILRLYLKTYLPTLFVQEDKVSMAHSVEARTPLCDNAMVALALKWPLDVKMHGNALKAIPKAAMRSRLPAVLYTLPKRGFPTPFAHWYRREPLQSYMRDLLFGPRTVERGLFRTAHLQGLFDRHVRSVTDNLYDYARASRLYSFSAVELWFRTFMDQAQPRPVA